MIETSEDLRAAEMLNALGNETRLRIFRALVRAGAPGLTVGDVQRRVGVPASTCAHHLSTLRQAGLVAQRREGREVFCVAQFDAMDGLVTYLTEACCADQAAPNAGSGSGASCPTASRSTGRATDEK